MVALFARADRTGVDVFLYDSDVLGAAGDDTVAETAEEDAASDHAGSFLQQPYRYP